MNTHDKPIDRASRRDRRDLYSQQWCWDEPGHTEDMMEDMASHAELEKIMKGLGSQG